MRAWQFVSKGEPITLREVAEPAPGRDEIAIHTLAAGLCHSDVGFLEGAIPTSQLGVLPRTLGHEVCGRVTAVGEEVTGIEVGDVMAIECMWDGPGVGRDGGYAARGVFPARMAVRVPTGVGSAAAAFATCGGRTALMNVRDVAKVTRGTRLGVVGLGGLGLVGMQIGLALGAEVYGADIKASARASALALGAAASVASVDELREFDLDVIVDFAGFGTTTADAMRVVRTGGTVVLVGLGRNEATIDTVDLALRSLTLTASAEPTLDHLRETLDLIAQGKLETPIATIGFSEIGAGLERLARGDVEGRLVAVFDDVD